MTRERITGINKFRSNRVMIGGIELVWSVFARILAVVEREYDWVSGRESIVVDSDARRFDARPFLPLGWNEE